MTRALGAGYVKAVIAGDERLRRDYIDTVPHEELLEAIDRQLVVMVRRVAAISGRDLSEVVDSFLVAARVFDALKLELPDGR